MKGTEENRELSNLVLNRLLLKDDSLLEYTNVSEGMVEVVCLHHQGDE
jgi:hypothetical protein